MDKQTVEQLEAIGHKSMLLVEQTAVELAPKVSNLLTAFSGWLDSKLLDNSTPLKK